MSTVVDHYPSRNGGDEYIIRRADPVVYPHQGGPLGADQLKFYEKHGYLVLPDYLPQIVEPLMREIDQLPKRMDGREECVYEPDSHVLRTVFKPFAFSDLIDQFFRLPEIARIAEQILGSSVYIMQSRVNIKPAYYGRSFAWHSDFETWHVEDGMPAMRALTAWIMLTDNHEHNGSLCVVPGSHHEYISCAGRTGRDNHKQSLRKQVLGVPRKETLDRVLGKYGIRSLTGRAGTVVFHECNLLHGSTDNISAEDRRILMCVYNSVHNAPVAPFGAESPRPDYLSHRDTRPLRRAELSMQALCDGFSRQVSPA